MLFKTDISVVIRNKNEEKSLLFLLKVLNNRFREDIDEIIVLDNLSTDNSKDVAIQNNARFITIKNFSYGGSANIAAKKSKNDIVVIFSAHSYPVSHDFFKLIKNRFKELNFQLAGLRCIHNNTDYTVYLENINPNDDPNLCGLIFSGSAFNKKIWEKHPFNDNVKTFEDKEWSNRMLALGYKIETVPSIFCYYVKRTPAQLFFRYKNDILGTYQLYGIEPKYKDIFYNFLVRLKTIHFDFFSGLFIEIKKLFFLIKIKLKKLNTYSLNK